jgi:DNA modification methylase
MDTKMTLEEIKQAIGITPFYEDESGMIYCADCLDLMKMMPDKSVSLCLTDPPYGINFDTEKESMSAMLRIDGSQRKCDKWSNPIPKFYPKGDWDSNPPSQEAFDEIFRVSNKQIIWGGNYFQLPLTGGWLVWDKGVVMPTLSKCELAWTSFLGHIEIKRYLWAGFRKEKPEDRTHTTQKPISLMEWCLSFAPDADLIFDPFLGSGTTAVAAKKLGRHFIGSEISETYCHIAEQRLEAVDTGVSVKEQNIGQLALFKAKDE